MNLILKYHGLPSLGITGKKGTDGESAGKIYFINKNNFEALFEFSDISITKYVYHILNKKFSNNEQVEFYLGGDENTISQTILNRQSYQYYPLSYSNTDRNTHNMRNFALVDKTSYFIIDDVSGETPDEDNENTNKSRIYLDQTYTSENNGKLYKYDDNGDLQEIDYKIAGDVQGLQGEPGKKIYNSSDPTVLKPYVIVRDSYGNVIYTCNEEGNLSTELSEGNKQWTTYDRSYKQDEYENPDESLIVKMPMKLRSIFKEGDIIFIKTDLLDKDKAPEEESSNDKDYNMLYISDDLVGAAYQKILNSLIELVFVKYPYVYNNVYETYHIDLRNVISSNCFRDEIYKKSMDIVDVDAIDDFDNVTSNTYNKYQKFKDHNIRSLESLITGDNSYQMTIIASPQTDVVNNEYYIEISRLNNDEHHQSLLQLTNILDVGENNTHKIDIWYNHNLHNSMDHIDKLRTPDKFDDLEQTQNQGYFVNNQVFEINVKNDEQQIPKIFIDDPYVRTDMLSNLFIKDVICDKNLVYEYGYLPVVPEENITTSYKQVGTSLKIFVNIRIPNSLIFNNTKNAKDYRITYFVKYKDNTKPVENGDIIDGKLSFEYFSDFVFIYGIESLNNGIRKYSKPIQINVDTKQLFNTNQLRIKNMINLNVTLNVKTLDTFDMLPDELLMYTHEKITYETEKSYMKIEINPDIEYAYLKSVKIYGVKYPGTNNDGIYTTTSIGQCTYDSNNTLAKWTNDDLVQREIEFTFDSNNKPFVGVYKYFYNDKKQNTFYKMVTDYVLNYRDYQDEKILVHYNKLDLRRHPKFDLKIETNGNTLETINSFNNGIYCNHFVTYLYLDIEDFDSKYWYTDELNQDNALLDVTISLANDITTNRNEIINRAFFKSFNKELTNINFKVTDITSCKNVAEQNEQVENHNLLKRLMLYTYNNDDITSKYDSGLQIFNKSNAKYTTLYNPTGNTSSELLNQKNFDFTIQNLTYENKHLKLRIDIELSNPVLSNVFMQWEVTNYNIHYSHDNITKSYNFDYLPLHIDLTNNTGSEIKTYQAKCYIQTNSVIDIQTYNDYILYVDNADIVKNLTDDTGEFITTHATFAFVDDIFERYSNNIKISETIRQLNPIHIYFVYNGSEDIENSICRSNAFNIAINPVEFIAGKNDETINNIIGGGTKYSGSEAQIQLYAGLVEPDYEFNNYIDLNNYILYKKYFQDNIKAITIESTGNVRLMVKYNADLFAAQSRFNNSVFYYNTEELEAIRYDKKHPLYFSNVNHRLIIRDDKLLKSMKAWNETYEKMTKYKTLTFAGNVSKYSNGYMLLQIKASNVQYKTYYYYNVIGKYKTEYFNKIVYNINDHQFDSKGLYTLTDTLMLNNVIVDNNEMKDSLYVNVEQPVIPTMYQPLRNQYYRTLMFDIDWIYLDSTGATNRDDEYEKHLVLYPRIAFNTTYDTINVLMLKQPLTYEKKYYFYNDYQLPQL